MSKEKTAKFFDSESKELMEMHTSKDIGKYEFDQLVQCINSQNVKLDKTELLKAYDAYLRTMGIVGSGTLDGQLTSIFAILGAVECVNPLATMIDIEKYKIYSDIFTKINSMLDDDHKFKDLDEILNNLRILYKDFTDFTNELMKSLYDEYNNNLTEYNITNPGENTYVDYGIFDDEDINKAMVFRGNTSDITDCFAIIYTSTVLSNDKPATFGIIVDTFPKKVQEELIKKSNATVQEEYEHHCQHDECLGITADTFPKKVQEEYEHHCQCGECHCNEDHECTCSREEHSYDHERGR